jgi:hypothetical protein
MQSWLALALAALVAGCATTDEPSRGGPALTADQGRARVSALLPERVGDRAGWAADIYAAFAALRIAPIPENICAALAVTEQESGYRVDPQVPGLAAIAWKEIERQRERAGIPKLVLDAALALPSSTGRSYAERIDAVRTELELSELFDDFVGQVPLGKRFLADRNPVRTGGPMQVGIDFAEAQVREQPYPYPIAGTVRREVFTRRGGMYFGIAHLLDYPAPYERPLYRFADFNAGRYASRNAAFQAALAQLSGRSLALDGDLLRYEGREPARDPGATELAARAIRDALGLDEAQIRSDLALGKSAAFERSRLYARVFARADRLAGKPLPRAVVPRIVLQSPKITRKLTTDWFAQRVEQRYQACLARSRA